MHIIRSNSGMRLALSKTITNYEEQLNKNNKNELTFRYDNVIFDYHQNLRGILTHWIKVFEVIQ